MGTFQGPPKNGFLENPTLSCMVLKIDPGFFNKNWGETVETVENSGKQGETVALIGTEGELLSKPCRASSCFTFSATRISKIKRCKAVCYLFITYSLLIQATPAWLQVAS